MRDDIPCMVHGIQLALGVFMNKLGVKVRTKSWKSHERNQQFGETERRDIGKTQALRKEGNARINKVSAMRPGLAKIIENVHISRHFEGPEIDHYIEENVCCVAWADTRSSKRVH